MILTLKLFTHLENPIPRGWLKNKVIGCPLYLAVGGAAEKLSANVFVSGATETANLGDDQEQCFAKRDRKSRPFGRQYQLAARRGLEPRLTEPKSAVLPLHHRAVCSIGIEQAQKYKTRNEKSSV